MSACVLCTGPLGAAPVIGTRDRDGVEVRRVECPTCSLVQASPRPSAEEIATHYAGDYWRDRKPAVLYLASQDGTVDAVAPADAERYEAALDTMARGRVAALERDLRLPPGARVLEVGCGDGRTLAGMLGLGWDAYGIEPDEGKADAARSRAGLRVSQCTLDELNVLSVEPPAEMFDAIVSFHVLEHLHDPLAALASMRRLLRPGGVLWLEVPDLANARQPLDGSWWQWAHLCDFTAETLTAMLRCAGLVDVQVRQTFGGLQAMGRHDPAVAARRYEPPMPSRSPLLTYIETAPPEVRAEWERYQAATHRIAAAYRDATHTLGELGTAMQADAEARLESWHPDDYVHGYTIGEATARRYAGATVVHVANAMRVLELTDGERG